MDVGTHKGPYKYRSMSICVCVCSLFNMWVKQTEIEDVYLHMCLWLMHNFVSENMSLPITVCLHFCVWVCAPASPAFWPCPMTLTVFGEALIDEEPPTRCVLSKHKGLAAVSTNPRAPNSAICPAMCSHLPAGSTQCRACLTHWQSDWDCAAPDWDQYFNKPGIVKH